jgi:hypothetical protein
MVAVVIYSLDDILRSPGWSQTQIELRTRSTAVQTKKYRAGEEEEKDRSDCIHRLPHMGFSVSMKNRRNHTMMFCGPCHLQSPSLFPEGRE